MFRATICLVLVFQMLLPTAALARFAGLSTAIGKPATYEEKGAIEAGSACDKICCCTNKPGCRCCDGGDNGSDGQESGHGQSGPSSKNAALHCKCPDLDTLNLSVDFFGHLRPGCIERFDPPQTGALHISSETYHSAFQSIDPHPPRQSL